MLQHEEQPSHGSSAVGRLSPRELQVLEGAARGATNVQIASDLSVSIHAVKFHLASVYRKLGVANRTEAVVALLGARAAEAGFGQP